MRQILEMLQYLSVRFDPGLSKTLRVGLVVVISFLHSCFFLHIHRSYHSASIVCSEQIDRFAKGNDRGPVGEETSYLPLVSLMN